MGATRWRDLAVAAEVGARLDEIERDELLSDDSAGRGFDARLSVLDWLHFEVFDRLRCALRERERAPLPGDADDRAELAALLQRAERLEARLDAINEGIWQRMRDGWRTSRLTPQELRRQIDGHTAVVSSREGLCYGVADAFVLGLLRAAEPPEPTLEREREMVYYQPTPVRFVLQMVDRARIGAEDVFYDLGSGLGHVVILVAMVTGARGVGIEFEPAYVDVARETAAAFDLGRVSFVNADAREVDYAAGTVSFLYTPFQGSILRCVLDRLAAEARTRTIRVATFGPCTDQVAREPWLNKFDDEPLIEEGLAIFTSREQIHP